MTNSSTATSSLPRILHIVHALDVGGLELQLANLVEQTQHRFSHSVCCIRRLGIIAERFRALAVPVYCLDKAEGHQWRLLFRIARLCRSARAQIVHTYNWAGIDGIFGAVLARTPVIIHSEHGFELADLGRRRGRRRRVRRLIAPLVDRMVAVSEHLRQSLVEEPGVRPGKITVIRTGVDTTRFRPLGLRHLLRSTHGFGPEDFVIGTVGRLAPEKNYPLLVDASRMLDRRGSHTQLLIIGDGEERQALRQYIARNGLEPRVRLLGFREDIPALLNVLDVFVLSSLTEGVSAALLEAMAVGLPVVATRVGGNPEVVEDGVTGQLVPPNDASALAEAVALYARDKSARLEHGRAGRDRVRREFTVESAVTAYVSLYEGALAHRNR